MEGDSISSSALTLSSSFQCTGANAFLLEWLQAYSEKRAEPLSLLSGTVFQQTVLKAISTVAFGNTISYQELAQRCGKPNGARAIGNACGRNPFPLFVPCHRIIRSDGSLGGFAADLEIKRRLLAFEQT
ncbi:MAG: methylated-DNA--[protein]-cysteine S-methyltransferase [Verrucomicrobia bacterium]|nr:methylated-DNA--[protein]-cysteine S-methyltransferase [Verrucomicrobiota bacterium]MDE3047875.1 methylated-DNA--[protein]-cysteine S-methyltransferase [Verrucomicrobiota bacterium]